MRALPSVQETNLVSPTCVCAYTFRKRLLYPACPHVTHAHKLPHFLNYRHVSHSQCLFGRIWSVSSRYYLNCTVTKPGNHVYHAHRLSEFLSCIFLLFNARAPVNDYYY